MPHVCSSPTIAAVPTPQAAEVCAHCGRCTSRTGHLGTQGTRACWTDSCTVSIEPHLQKALSADDRTPPMAFSRNGSFGNAMVAARGEAALKKVERAACAGRLVLRQRVVAYAAIGYNHASFKVGKPCSVRVPSIVACRRIPPFSCQLKAWRE